MLSCSCQKSGSFELGTRHFLVGKCSTIFIFWLRSSSLFGLSCFLFCPSQRHRWTTRPLTSQNLLCGSYSMTNQQPEKNPGNKKYINVTSFSSISYYSNSEYWTQKSTHSESIHSVILDVYVLKAEHQNSPFFSAQLKLH